MAARALPEDLRELERRHVSEVYDQIAAHFTDIRHKAWPKVRQFLKELEPGSLVADVGCGNGRYLHINKKIYKLGSDLCEGLVNIANQRGYNAMVSDNLKLPYRDGVFDAAISIAVIHHFATVDRRIQALRELARIIRPGGKIMICVWAFEQKHRRFDGQDVLVPWNKPTKFHRKRATSKSSAGTGSDFSSTSSVSEDDAVGDVADTDGILLTNQNQSIKTFTSETTSSEQGIQQNGCLEVTNSPVSSSMTVSGNHSADVEAEHVNASHDTCPCSEKESSSSCRHCESLCTSCRLRQSRKASKAFPCSTTCGVFSNTVEWDSSKGSAGVQKPQNPPVRPSSLHLLHRHTAGISPSQNCRRQTTISYNTQRRSIPMKLEASRHITSCQNKICPSFTKDKKLPRHCDQALNCCDNHSSATQIPQCFPQDKNKMVLSCSPKPLTHERPGDGTQEAKSSLHTKQASIKEQFCHKQQAAAVLTVCRNNNQTRSPTIAKQEPSLLDRLKTLIMGKSRSMDNDSDYDAKTSQDQLSSVWRDYYKSCVKDVEQDLKSFKSFCSLTNAQQQQDVLCREFVVREFPGSSQLKGSLCSIDDPEPRASVGRKLHKKEKNGCMIDNSSTIYNNGAHVSSACEKPRCLDDNGNPYSTSQNGLESRGRQPKELVVKGTKEARKGESFSTGEHRQDVSYPAEKPVNHCSGGTVESSMDEVFEDFTTSMSTCLTNLSRKESGESFGKPPAVTQGSSCQRYYHVFREGELEELITVHVPILNIVNSYFDHANWCLIAEKISSL
ncbi:uncharacterized protein LOC135473420 [Liolophura sinensis]|uniref:uncharacterized protein LOC135473420 n=1 Tax=Liolophura sinensis TaxID=3198878 RepID=UPI0031595E5D